MVLDASKFIPVEAIEKLPAFDDKCIDLVVTAPPGYREKGNDMTHLMLHCSSYTFKRSSRTKL